jgi:hypothetical protein
MLDQYMQPGPPMPGWGPQLMHTSAWASGDILVVPIYGAQFPAVCPKTGEPTRDELLVKLNWQPQWVYVLLLLGVVPFAIASMVTQKRATIRFPMSAPVIARRRIGRIVGIGGFIASIALMIFGGSQDTPVIFLVALLAMLAALIYMVIAVRLFKVVKITDHFALLRGVHPSFLQLFTQGPLPVPI